MELSDLEKKPTKMNSSRLVPLHIFDALDTITCEATASDVQTGAFGILIDIPIKPPEVNNMEVTIPLSRPEDQWFPCAHLRAYLHADIRNFADWLERETDKLLRLYEGVSEAGVGYVVRLLPAKEFYAGVADSMKSTTAGANALASYLQDPEQSLKYSLNKPTLKFYMAGTSTADTNGWNPYILIEVFQKETTGEERGIIVDVLYRDAAVKECAGQIAELIKAEYPKKEPIQLSTDSASSIGTFASYTGIEPLLARLKERDLLTARYLDRPVAERDEGSPWNAGDFDGEDKIALGFYFLEQRELKVRIPSIVAKLHAEYHIEISKKTLYNYSELAKALTQ